MLYTTNIQQSTEQTICLGSSWQIAREIINTGAKEVEVRVIDPRDISKIQRRKARALIGEIAKWSGHFTDYVHDMLKLDYCIQNDLDSFSLSDTSMAIARGYISYLIDFCIRMDVPIKRPLYEFCDDIEAMVYSCLANRKCVVCNTPKADIHHCTGSRVGMGRDRKKIIHVGLVCLPLCRECHDECHKSEIDFLNKHHLVGLPLDEWLCQKLGLNTTAD